jgi:glucan phosphorylase
MREEAGAENFFLFGLTVKEVERIKRDGYRPSDYINGELAGRARPDRRRGVLPR